MVMMMVITSMTMMMIVMVTVCACQIQIQMYSCHHLLLDHHEDDGCHGLHCDDDADDEGWCQCSPPNALTSVSHCIISVMLPGTVTLHASLIGN